MIGNTYSSWVPATQAPAWQLCHRPQAARSAAASLRDSGRSPRRVGRRTRPAHGERGLLGPGNAGPRALLTSRRSWRAVTPISPKGSPVPSNSTGSLKPLRRRAPRKPSPADRSPTGLCRCVRARDVLPDGSHFEVDDLAVGAKAPASFVADFALTEQGRYAARDLTAALTCSGLAATLMPARNATGCIPVPVGRMPEERGIATLRTPHRPPDGRTSGVTRHRTRLPPKRSWKQMWSRIDHLHHLFADHVCNRLQEERRRRRCGLVCAPDEELAGVGRPC